MAIAQRLRSGEDRRTIIKTFQSLGGFCGWPYMLETQNSIAEPETKQVFNGLGILGCRRMELPLLTRGQVDLDSSDDWIRIRAMYVEKQKKSIDMFHDDGTNILRPDGKNKYTFESIAGWRTFSIDRKNPLAEVFIKYVETFPNKTDKDKDTILYPYTGNQIYYRICTIGMKLPEGVNRSQWAYYMGEWWPHRMRAERACQLIQDRRFDIFRLLSWFGWKSQKMALLYGTIQGAGLEDDTNIIYRI